MKHTPGTWIACEDDEREGMPFIPIETETDLVAQVEPDMDEATQEFYISERTRANANLIAAAPDLFEAVCQAMRILESRPRERSVYEVLWRAVKKAEGGVC